MGRQDVEREGICGTCWGNKTDPRKRKRPCGDCDGTGKRWVCSTCKEAMPCSGTDPDIFDQTLCTKRQP